MKTQAVSFPKNMYHYCQHNFVDRDLLQVKFKPEERRLGALPVDWLKNFKTKKYAKITKRIDKLFRKFAIKSSLNQINAHEFRLGKKLSRILHRDDVKIKYENEGFFKKCYKLTIGSYSYALLTFKKLGNYLESDTIEGHGALVEPCRIFDFYKEYSHGRVAKPFMTRFVNEDKNDGYDGYMLMKFIDKKDTEHAKCRLPLYQKDFYTHKMVDFKEGNLINGIIVDIGMISKNDDAIKSSKFRQNLFNILGCIEKEVYPCPDAVNSFLLNTTERFVYELMEKGEDIYNLDLREMIEDFSPLEKKYIIKKIRALKKAHKLKLELQKNGEYELYKKYIDEYIRMYNSKTMEREFSS